MEVDNLINRDFSKEIDFSFSRSSGPGGQNVNKVNTRAELRYNIVKSALLSPSEKEILLKKLTSKINKVGELIIVAQSERSQIRNKEKAEEKFYRLLAKVLTLPKKRKPTSPTLASRKKRLENKRLASEKKQIRRNTDE